jgi:hypothetical protein
MIAEILFAAVFSVASVQDTNNMKRDVTALELFLKDQEEYRIYCPQIKWSQPNIEVYKKSLVSQLPKGCKV